MSKRLTTEDFIHRARSVHGDKYDYSQSVYTGKDKSIVIICPIHGKFLQTPNNHWKGKGCATCSGNKKYSTSDFIAKSRSVHGHTYQYDHVHYVNVDTPVSITCPIHGDFEQTPAKHMSGRGCPLCGVNKMKKTNHDKYGTQYAIQSDIVQAKIKRTCLDRYGVKNPGGLDFVQEKIQQTNMERYHVPYAITSDIVSDKARNTLFANYGVTTPFASTIIRQKADDTMITRYGTVNPICNPTIAKKTYDTNIKRYGYPMPLQSPSIRHKCQQTLTAHYGVDNPFKSDVIRQQIQNTLLDRYGVCATFKSDIIQDRAQQTMLARYGVRYPFQSESIRQKSMQTCMAKYGCKYAVQSSSVRHKLSKRISSKETQKKMIKTKRQNKTFHTSIPEEKLYHMLVQKYGVNDVVRQYFDERYPFACDFYIKSKDLFIELNAMWTHGGHFFNENDPDDIAKLKKWQKLSEHSRFYRNAIHTWTVSDLQKLKTANDNELNYIVLYDVKKDAVKKGFKL